MICVGDVIYSVEFKRKGFVEYNGAKFHNFDSNGVEFFFIGLRFKENNVHSYRMKINKQNYFHVKMLLIEKKWSTFNR